MHQIKIWKFFKSKYVLLYGSDVIWDVFRIVCAIYNTFRAPIIKPAQYQKLNQDSQNIIKMINAAKENDIANVECKTTTDWKKSSILTLKEE